MIKAFQKDEQFLADVKSVDRASDHFHLWWLGQSGYLIHWKTSYILLDPYLSDSLTKKYAESDKPHIRMTELVVDPSKLDFISLVTSSHNHTDHLDGETLRPLLTANPQINLVVPKANLSFVSERVQCDENYPIGLAQGESVNIGGFSLHAIPAAHNKLDKDPKGRCKYLGYIIQFGSWSIYHSGDTIWYPGLENHLKSFDLDLALLPINGNKPERRVAGNFDGKEAAQLAKAVGAKMVIPCHYDMFTFNTETPELFIRTCEQLDQSFTVLQSGQSWSSANLD